MPTTRKRRTHNARRARITDEAVEAFKIGDWLRLHRALNLRPWEASPLDVGTEREPLIAPPMGTSYADSVPQAERLKAELELSIRE